MLKVNYQKEFYKKYIENQKKYTPDFQHQPNYSIEQIVYSKPYSISNKRLF